MTYIYICDYFDKIMVSKRTWTMINDPDQEISFYNVLLRCAIVFIPLAFLYNI